MTTNASLNLLNAQNRTLDVLTTASEKRAVQEIEKDQTVEELRNSLNSLFDKFANSAAFLGESAANRHLRLIGLTSDATHNPAIDDIKGKLNEAISEYEAALSELERVPEALRVQGKENNEADQEKARAAAVRRLSFRTKLGAAYTIQRTYNEATITKFKGAETDSIKLGKMWVVSYANGNIPCPACAALSGRIVPLESEFPSHHFPRVWGTLFGPPRHPNCRCKLSVVVLTDSKEEISLPVPELPKMLKKMSSEGIRKMPEKRFIFIRKVFMSVISALRKLKK